MIQVFPEETGMSEEIGLMSVTISAKNGCITENITERRSTFAMYHHIQEEHLVSALLVGTVPNKAF